ncbi:hypothetical protein PG993_003972 [Apiospora rasikravindrae]|uniref:Phytanoyl-CoA dioxygenase n=1 Tax=Apiospora rasikravindrae TaxID=990691 RepID=A0ABR1U102_9PEZI
MAAAATTTTTTPSGIDELLKHQTLQTLTPDQVASFLRHGFLRVPGAIPPETCDRWTRDVWPRLGMDPEDKATWHTERSHLAKLHLCGGEDRIVMPGGGMWTDGFIVNLGTPSSGTEPESEEGKRVKVPPRELTNWHVDGDFFVHFLDSPEQALLVIPCWSDVGEDAGATWICDEGPRRIGKMLYDHPEGLNPMMNARHESLRPPFQHSVFNKIIQGAPDSSFHEMTGEKGDVILMHPLMLHSASVRPRMCRSLNRKNRNCAGIITNPPVSLRSPFQFDRADPSTYSLVELKTMRDLEGGPAALRGWKATGPRDMFMPVRLAAQERKRDEEIARLRALGIETADPEFSQGPYLLISQQQEAVTTSGLTA